MVRNPSVKFQFTLTPFLMNDIGAWTPDIRRAFLMQLLPELKAQGYVYDQFKQLPLGGERLEEAITKVHKLQGHF